MTGDGQKGIFVIVWGKDYTGWGIGYFVMDVRWCWSHDNHNILMLRYLAKSGFQSPLVRQAATLAKPSSDYVPNEIGRAHV